MEELHFIFREEFKNGSTKIHFIDSELYKVLYNMGYRFVRIESKPYIYFQDMKTWVRFVRHFQDLRDAFVDYVKHLDIPEFEIHEILNTFYAKRPMKRNGSLYRYLTDTSEPGIYLIEELKKQKDSL